MIDCPPAELASVGFWFAVAIVGPLVPIAAWLGVVVERSRNQPLRNEVATARRLREYQRGAAIAMQALNDTERRQTELARTEVA